MYRVPEYALCEECRHRWKVAPYTTREWGEDVWVHPGDVVKDDFGMDAKCPRCGCRQEVPEEEPENAESTALAADIIDDWLESIAARWEAAVTAKPPRMDDLDDIPPSPGIVSFNDLIVEVRERLRPRME